jgi:hypothetical protein
MSDTPKEVWIQWHGDQPADTDGPVTTEDVTWAAHKIFDADLGPYVLKSDLERELNEQCVLNGKGAQREAALLGKVERLERENARLRDYLRELLGFIREPLSAYVHGDIDLLPSQINQMLADVDTARAALTSPHP